VRKAFLLKLLSDLRASYWFIPGCLVLVAAAGAFGTLALDEFDIVQDALHPLALPRLDAGGMRTILSVIAQSVMGVAGVMFSITMVAVSHASSQFGPRLIGNFMRDRGNQWSLGILIATFVYALIVLRHITGDGLAPNAYPHLTLMISLALALISVCTVIFYVHHVPETINVANISASLGRRLIAAIEATASDAAPREEPDGASNPCPVCLETQGYVLQIDIPLLDRIATAEGTTIRVEVRPGDFVTTYTRVATLDRDATDMAATVRAGFAVGGARIEDQDLTFLVDQQVEMVARALSPGVNDPQTAINCLNWLAAALAVADHEGSSFGLEGTDAVVIRRIGWTDLLEKSFGASWDYARQDRLARQSWCDLLDTLQAGVGPGNAASLRAFRAVMEKRSAD
jgi:uncharacterized membrane protein